MALVQLINIYTWAIIIYALLSWFPGAYSSWLGRFLARIVEPFQSMFNFASIGMIGLAPVVAVFVLWLVQKGIIYVGQLIILNFG
ncbi:YggT family protein [Lentilactobacillus sp. Marseille-Q4993]|uniref:YggT family protein n=1 Tax=Lentilactobacillus sp. Marseille-Q4993 TaxID=3039492 RepID=UPI0024BCAEF5|nr:YggT family protein [Lentilactobacillus sp. Marseille-Q4993]